MACVWTSTQVLAGALGLITGEIVIEAVWAPNPRGRLTRNSLVYNEPAGRANSGLFSGKARLKKQDHPIVNPMGQAWENLRPRFQSHDGVEVSTGTGGRQVAAILALKHRCAFPAHLSEPEDTWCWGRWHRHKGSETGQRPWNVRDENVFSPSEQFLECHVNTILILPPVENTCAQRQPTWKSTFTEQQLFPENQVPALEVTAPAGQTQPSDPTAVST